MLQLSFCRGTSLERWSGDTGDQLCNYKRMRYGYSKSWHRGNVVYNIFAQKCLVLPIKPFIMLQGVQACRLGCFLRGSSATPPTHTLQFLLLPQGIIICSSHHCIAICAYIVNPRHACMSGYSSLSVCPPVCLSVCLSLNCLRNQ